jgi:hypothetical protein
MTGAQLRNKRVTKRIPGDILCVKLGLTRAKLSGIERGHIQLKAEEAQRIDSALDELIRARKAMAATAAKFGWPATAL